MKSTSDDRKGTMDHSRCNIDGHSADAMGTKRSTYCLGVFCTVPKIFSRSCTRMIRIEESCYSGTRRLTGGQFRNWFCPTGSWPSSKPVLHSSELKPDKSEAEPGTVDDI